MHATDWATWSFIIVGCGAILMGVLRVFGVFHHLASAIEDNTRGLAENTKRLDKVADKIEDHALRIVKLEVHAEAVREEKERIRVIPHEKQ